MRTLISKIVTVVVGIAFIVVAIVMMNVSKNTQKLCTEEVEATVVNVETIHTTDDDGTSTEYKPTFKFEYNGETYKVEGTESGTYYSVDEVVTIKINPEDPTMFTYGNQAPTWMFIIFIVVGAVVILLGIFGRTRRIA